MFDGAVAPDPVEQRILSVEGIWRWTEWFIIPLRDESGKIYELQSIGHDITERKRLESNKRASI